MEIAFYAPLKSPWHAVPSGDRQMARGLIKALEIAGHTVNVASRFRSWSDGRDPQREKRLARIALWEAQKVIERVSEPCRPEIWFTYHGYYKAPDWLGPAVSAALKIPYVIAEASFARKHASGQWKMGHEQTQKSLRAADRVIALLEYDFAGLAEAVEDSTRVVHLSPFIEPPKRVDRPEWRRRWARRLGLSLESQWLLTVAMMRAGSKRDSYRVLAQALTELKDSDWSLLMAGDGECRRSVMEDFSAFSGVRSLGVLEAEELLGAYASADIFVWPAINEAYGMALLEAQGHGLAVVAGKTPGVSEIIADSESGILTSVGDSLEFARGIQRLLDDSRERTRMGKIGRKRVQETFSIVQASRRLDQICREVVYGYGRVSV